jgi:hypothetical protein
MLQIFGTALSREQMKNVKGGVMALEMVDDGDGRGYCGGMCNGVLGKWDYVGLVSEGACLQDIQTYCQTGHGYCTLCV